MKEHGTFEISLSGQVITVVFHGMWNEATAKRVGQEFQQEAMKISGEPWACLIDFQDWQLGSQEVFDEISRINLWCNQNNQRHEAVVCSKFLQKQLMAKSQANLAQAEIGYFSTPHEAKRWLMKKGYTFDLTDYEI